MIGPVLYLLFTHDIPKMNKYQFANIFTINGDEPREKLQLPVNFSVDGLNSKK